MSNIHGDAERLRAMVDEQDELIGRLLAEVKSGRDEYKELLEVVKQLMQAYGPSPKPEVIKGLTDLANCGIRHFKRVMASRILIKEVTPEQLAKMMDEGKLDG